MLANEELDHFKTLLTFKTALQNNGKWLDLTPKQSKRIRMPRLYEGKGSVPLINSQASDLDILVAAMRAEKRTEQFYTRISKKVRDPKTKSFFTFLAKFERGHYNLLKTLLETS
jgi:rubrerythrin